jgi:hypothetical protein
MISTTNSKESCVASIFYPNTCYYKERLETRMKSAGGCVWDDICVSAKSRDLTNEQIYEFKMKFKAISIFFRHSRQFFQLYDSGQVLLVEERTQTHYTMYLGRDHRPSASKDIQSMPDRKFGHLKFQDL